MYDFLRKFVTIGSTERTAVKWSAVFAIFSLLQVEWRRCKVEMTLFMPAW